jgi:hypothetical protein
MEVITMRKSNRLHLLRFSPEFEFKTSYDKQDIKDEFLTQGLDWDVKRDASIENGWEVCPMGTNHLKGNTGMAECDRVVNILNEKFNARQTYKTGFHIHWQLLDDDGLGIMTPKQLTNIMVDWFNFKRVIELILPESRRGDNQTNLWGVSIHSVQALRNVAEDVGANDSTQLAEFIRRVGNHSTSDIRISSAHSTLEFRKAIFTVDNIKLSLWIEFTRNLIGYNCKARQKNFRKIWSNPQDRLSLTHDKGLAWSFRQVWEYRAGNLGLLEVAERRALQLARGNTSHQEAIRGITQRIKDRYNR